jgi:hypothetical protein
MSIDERAIKPCSFHSCHNHLWRMQLPDAKYDPTQTALLVIDGLVVLFMFGYWLLVGL